VLDALLVEAAAQAGAELRTGYSVEELLVEGATVVGIRARTKGGTRHDELARIVIGADGVHSLVARAVRALSVLQTCSRRSATRWRHAPCDRWQALSQSQRSLRRR
jgi:flavin-dependent dehydrogenase